MTAAHLDQNLIIKTLEDAGGMAAFRMFYESFFQDRFWLILSALIVLLISVGVAWVIFYPFGKDKVDGNNVLPQLEKNKWGYTENDVFPQVNELPFAIPEKYREVFLQTMEEDVNILNRALIEGCTRSALRMLHRMHGALAAVGMIEFAERCELLGQEGRLYGLEDGMAGKIAELARDLKLMLRQKRIV